MSVEDEYVEIARKGFTDAQAIMALRPRPSTAEVHQVEATWYDTSVSPMVGSFAMVKDGGALADLVGDFIQVRRRTKSVRLYVYGLADLAVELGISRRGWLALGDLAVPTMDVRVEVLG